MIFQIDGASEDKNIRELLQVAVLEGLAANDWKSFEAILKFDGEKQQRDILREIETVKQRQLHEGTFFALSDSVLDYNSNISKRNRNMIESTLGL